MIDYTKAIAKLQELADQHFACAQAMEQGKIKLEGDKMFSKNSIAVTPPSGMSAVDQQNYMGNCCAMAAFILESAVLKEGGDAE